MHDKRRWGEELPACGWWWPGPLEDLLQPQDNVFPSGKNSGSKPLCSWDVPITQFSPMRYFQNLSPAFLHIICFRTKITSFP